FDNDGEFAFGKVEIGVENDSARCCIFAFESRVVLQRQIGEGSCGDMACLWRGLAESGRLDYNHRRPHSGLNYMTTAAFAATCIASASVFRGLRLSNTR
ncbi:MAG: hypothetical protein JW749_07685, partial [Sedimentisphaerales bacterium]|nr:hypothetical protein [Sedimentisphaerales bacterium]